MGTKGNSWDNPCYNEGNGCPDRTVGCHSSCKKHLEWLEEHNKLLEKKHDESAKRSDAESYSVNFHQKLTKVVNRAKSKRGWVK